MLDSRDPRFAAAARAVGPRIDADLDGATCAVGRRIVADAATSEAAASTPTASSAPVMPAAALLYAAAPERVTA